MSNVGAYIDGVRPKSKKAVRDAVNEAPETVEFDVTDAMGAHAGRRYTVETLPAGETFYLCGPDPYQKRVFYGQVARGAKGVTVK